MPCNKHRTLRLLLCLTILTACSEGGEVKRRSISPSSLTMEKAAGTESADQAATEPSYGTLDNDFNPEDPNTFARKAGVAFPELKFSVGGIPTGPTDIYNYSLPVTADASISHYAYKLDINKTCDKTGGYTVSEAKNPIPVSLDKTPYGPVYLCVIAFHFPTRQWQDITKALAFNWEKLIFKREIDSYFEFIDSQCRGTARINARLKTEADKGSYVWQRVQTPGCAANSTVSTTDLMSQITVSEQGMQGVWHEGNVVAGWFKFTWSNAARTTFKGTWGYGEPGVKTEGVWNSVAN